MKIMSGSKHYVINILIHFNLLTGIKFHVKSQCIDNPCDRPQFCSPDEYAADPDDCKSYYRCATNKWVKLSCGSQTLFDYEMCVCNHENTPNCFSECPSSITKTTPLPGTCPNVPDPCVDGERYPDRASCVFYYKCQNGVLGARTECVVGEEHGTCVTPGVPCLFDIELSHCVPYHESFNCEYRCVTTLFPPSTPPMTSTVTGEYHTTEKVDTSTSDDYTTSQVKETTSGNGIITTEESQTTDNTVTTESLSTLETTRVEELTTHETTRVEELTTLETTRDGELKTTANVTYTKQTTVTTTTVVAQTTFPLEPPGLSAFAVLGIVITTGGTAVLVIVLVIFFLRNKDSTQSKNGDTPMDSFNEDDGALETNNIDKDALIMVNKFGQPGQGMLWRRDPALSAEQGHREKWHEGQQSDLANISAKNMDNPLYQGQEIGKIFNDNDSSDLLKND